MFVMYFGSVSPLSSSPLPPFIFSILIEAARYPIRNSSGWKDDIEQFFSETACSDCAGTRLNPTARSVQISGKSISELTAMAPGELLTFLSGLNFTQKQSRICRPVLQELIPKLELLIKSGLSYLTLDRAADTLSGGEAQRMRLAAQTASNLRGALYVLDEPTIGLHPHDTRRMLAIIRELQSRGNSVIVVEHDEDTIRAADHIIDLGPGGGRRGAALSHTARCRTSWPAARR